MEEHHPALFCKQNPCLSAIVKLSNILDSHFLAPFQWIINMHYKITVSVL